MMVTADWHGSAAGLDHKYSWSVERLQNDWNKMAETAIDSLLIEGSPLNIVRCFLGGTNTACDLD
jgi:hypothetical protein